MEKIILKGNRVLFGVPGKNPFVAGSIVIEDDKIIDLCMKKHYTIGDNVMDFGDNYILPGFIDNHTHGAIGIDTSSCTLENLEKLSIFFASKGVTSYLPTLITNPKEKLLYAIKTIQEYTRKQKNGAQIIGIHMEGPCINTKYRGAQNEDSIVLPNITDFKDYISQSNNMIKLITLAPELHNALATVKFLSNAGIAINLGHSDATFDISMKSFDMGIGCVSHFLNGMRCFHQHEPSIMGAVLMHNTVYSELICDGFHLAPSTVRILSKVLGSNRIILVTDSILAAELEDGTYSTQSFDEPLIVNKGDTQLAYSKSRAGSTITLDKAFKNYMDFAVQSVEEAVQCVTINPASHLGMGSSIGSIEIGKKASFTILDINYKVSHTIINGKVAYMASS